jgi:hypothetical protein
MSFEIETTKAMKAVADLVNALADEPKLAPAHREAAVALRALSWVALWLAGQRSIALHTGEP